MENLIDDELEASSSDDETDNDLMIKQNRTMRKIMMNLMHNLLKAKTVF